MTPPSRRKPCSARISTALRRLAQSRPRPSLTGSRQLPSRIARAALHSLGQHPLLAGRGGVTDKAQGRAGEIALGPLHQPVEQIGIGPFEVEGEDQRLADPRIGEQRPAGVDGDRRRRSRQAGGHDIARHLAACRPWEFVVTRPARRIALGANVDQSPLEGLERRIAVENSRSGPRRNSTSPD